MKSVILRAIGRDINVTFLAIILSNTLFFCKPLSANPKKWSNTLKQFVGKLPTNCLSVFEHFAGLALKGLTNYNQTCKAYFDPNHASGWSKLQPVLKKVIEFLKELNILIVNDKMIIRKHLGNKGLHLNTYGTAQLTMNFIATVRKSWQPFGYSNNTFDSETINKTEKTSNKYLHTKKD